MQEQDHSDNDTDFGDIIDSDNEIGQDDDDLFDEWVDMGVEAHCDVKERKKNDKCVEDHDYDIDDPDLPSSDEEEEENKKTMKFTSFRVEDLIAPSFKLGMTFPSVVDLRATLNEYSIQNRVAIKYAKNDLQKVRAHCAEGCPWFIFAAPDSRTKSLW